MKSTSENGYLISLSREISQYGNDYLQLLRDYPTISNTKQHIVSIDDAVDKDTRSLRTVDELYGEGASLLWIKVMLIELSRFLGAYPRSITDSQIVILAKAMRSEYADLTFAELKHFFYRFMLGRYGKLYVGHTVNPQDITCALIEYRKELTDARGRCETKRKQKEKAKQMEEDKANSVRWEDIHPDEPSPLEKIKQYIIRKHGKQSR